MLRAKAECVSKGQGCTSVSPGGAPLLTSAAQAPRLSVVLMPSPASLCNCNQDLGRAGSVPRVLASVLIFTRAMFVPLDLAAWMSVQNMAESLGTDIHTIPIHDASSTHMLCKLWMSSIIINLPGASAVVAPPRRILATHCFSMALPPSRSCALNWHGC